MSAFGGKAQLHFAGGARNGLLIKFCNVIVLACHGLKSKSVAPSGEFDGVNTVDEIIDKVARELLFGINWWHDVREQDHADLVAMVRDVVDRVYAFIDAIKARPYVANHQQGRPALPRSNGKDKHD